MRFHASWDAWLILFIKYKECSYQGFFNANWILFDFYCFNNTEVSTIKSRRFNNKCSIAYIKLRLTSNCLCFWFSCDKDEQYIFIVSYLVTCIHNFIFQFYKTPTMPIKTIFIEILYVLQKVLFLKYIMKILLFFLFQIFLSLWISKTLRVVWQIKKSRYGKSKKVGKYVMSL